MLKLPKLKKKIESFLTKEDGKISKENLIKAGIILGAVAAIIPEDTDAVSTPHSNALSVSYSDPTAIGSHTHAPSSHSNY